MPTDSATYTFFSHVSYMLFSATSTFHALSGKKIKGNLGRAGVGGSSNLSLTQTPTYENFKL